MGRSRGSTEAPNAILLRIGRHGYPLCDIGSWRPPAFRRGDVAARVFVTQTALSDPSGRLASSRGTWRVRTRYNMATGSRRCWWSGQNG